jgi:hypothetical protein
VKRRQWRKLKESDKEMLKFRVRGKEVETPKIERWMKRYNVLDNRLYAPNHSIGEWWSIDRVRINVV